MAAKSKPRLGELLTETTRYRERFGFGAMRDLIDAVAGVSVPDQIAPNKYKAVIMACRGESDG